jgi:hypothetical protein
MPAMIDHIAAVVIGAAILLMVFGLTMRTNDSALGATQVDLAKAELRTLVDIVEQDLVNMGSGMARPNASADERVIREYSSNGSQMVLRFTGLPGIGIGLDPVEFIYRWEEDGVVVFPDGTSVTTFVLEREVDGVIATFERLVDLSVALLDHENAVVPIGSLASELRRVRSINISLGVVSPAGPDNVIQQSRWTKSFTPINLEGYRQIIGAEP